MKLHQEKHRHSHKAADEEAQNQYNMLLFHLVSAEPQLHLDFCEVLQRAHAQPVEALQARHQVRHQAEASARPRRCCCRAGCGHR